MIEVPLPSDKEHVVKVDSLARKQWPVVVSFAGIDAGAQSRPDRTRIQLPGLRMQCSSQDWVLDLGVEM